MFIIRLLDCAFLFFSNYPCRLALSELHSDLPCEESIFSSEHPFAEENFRFSRGLMASEAFDMLFQRHNNESPSQLPSSNSYQSWTPGASVGRIGIFNQIVTPMDLFLLIHRKQNLLRRARILVIVYIYLN